jgi:hypothetical protein
VTGFGWRPWPREVGRPRYYAPGDPPTIYPGEQAEADLDLVVAATLIAGAVARGETSARLLPAWHVTPIPGWRGRFLRARFRLVGDSGGLGLVAAFNRTKPRRTSGSRP